MENDVVIKVEGLYKKFSKSLKRSMIYGTVDTARSFLGFSLNQGRLRKSEFWALEDINFELKRGEILGIIGVNGSGKSTLLRLLTGIFPPDRGKITTDGRVGGLIAVGAGFHPHMTGRENIYLNGIILGMTTQEINEKFEQIVSFSEIGDFLDAPVSTYSSGMKVRLGFAIAVHVEPEILLIDEVLSVGDMAFRNKSLRFMHELRSKAKGIIFISHNLEQIRSLCTRVIVMDKGRVVFDGDTHEGCVMYEEINRDIRIKNDEVERLEKKGEHRQHLLSADGIETVNLGILNSEDKETLEIGMDEKLKIFADIKITKNIGKLYFSAGVVGSDDYKPIIHLVSNDNQKANIEITEPGEYRLTAEIEKHHLVPNTYLLNFAVRNETTGETYERIFSNRQFKVKADKSYLTRGVIAVKDSWKLYKK